MRQICHNFGWSRSVQQEIILNQETRDLELAIRLIDPVQFGETLERLRILWNLELRAWVELLQLSVGEYAQLKSGVISPSLRWVEDLAEQLDLDPLAWIKGGLDWDSIAARTQGKVVDLPERYSRGAFSKRRTSIHLLDHMEAHLGWRVKNLVLRRLGVSESALLDADGQISIHFLRDLCDQIQLWGFKSDALFRMGRHSVLSNFNSPLGEKYRSLGHARELYESTFVEFAPQYYDRNHQYRMLESHDEYCRVQSSCSSEVSEALKSKRFGSQNVCVARAGTFSGIAGYLLLPFAEVHEERCIHRGDEACIYRIDYSHANAVSRRLA